MILTILQKPRGRTFWWNISELNIITLPETAQREQTEEMRWFSVPFPPILLPILPPPINSLRHNVISSRWIWHYHYMIARATTWFDMTHSLLLVFQRTLSTMSSCKWLQKFKKEIKQSDLTLAWFWHDQSLKRKWVLVCLLWFIDQFM